MREGILAPYNFMVGVLCNSVAIFRGETRKCAKNSPFLVPTLGDHCEVGIDLLGLISCTAIDHKSANVLQK